MSVVKRWLARGRSRVRSASRRSRLAAAALAALAVGGTVWLAVDLAGGTPEWASVLSAPATPDDLAQGARLAEDHGIGHRIEDGTLRCPCEQAGRLRALLAGRGLAAPAARGAVSFEKIFDGADILRTPDEIHRRWLAVLMAELSRLIERFATVERATVLLQPGVRRGLGRPAVPPSASVKVTMAGGARMDGRLAAAIADLVSGCVTGMERSDVRVIDNRGRSWRPEAGFSGADDPVERLRRAEEHFRRKLQEALAYIDGVAVGVCVEPAGEVFRCRSASVFVPRSHLAAICRAAGRASHEPNSAEIDAFADAELAKMRHGLAHVVGAAEPNAVQVDWYYDALAAAPVAAAGATEPRAGGPAAGTFLAVGLAVLGLLAAVLALRRHGRSAAAVRATARAAGPADGAPADGNAPAGGAASGQAVAVLQRTSVDELRAMLLTEHPQTVALVLAHVEATSAAAVLDGFAEDRQVDVTRRIAELPTVAPDVVAEVVRGLTRSRRQARASEAAPTGGVSKVARILHHAGYATEKAVLAGLNGRQPGLAESIRRRMFAFEDVALLPREVLKQALESLGSDELAVALRTAGREVKEKVLSAVSRSTAGKVRMEMDRIGPVRLSDVEAAQERVVSAVRRLEAGRYAPVEPRKDSEVLA